MNPPDVQDENAMERGANSDFATHFGHEAWTNSATAFERPFYVDSRPAASTYDRLTNAARVLAASWTPAAAVVGAAATFTVSIEQYSSAGAHVATVATATLTANQAAFVPLTLTMAGGPDFELNTGDVLTAKIAQAGTGQSAPAGQFTAEMARVV